MFIHNISGSTQNYLGTQTADDAYYQISESKRVAIANNEFIINELMAGNAKMSTDGATDLSGNPIDHVNYLKGLVPVSVESTAYPFASKVMPDGKKLYKRVHGQSASVSTTQSSHKFTVPYTSCKITGVEVLGAELGDFVDLNILDTATGTVSTIPNYKLNQFGFNVYMGENSHKEVSNYDADLFAGLQIEILYTSISTKTVYFNYILHELKD